MKTKQTVDRTATDDDFKFDYGTIEIRHRFYIDKPICHDVVVLDRVISVTMIHKTKGWEFQILYRDENFKSHCDIYKIEDYIIKVKYKGDMGISL